MTLRPESRLKNRLRTLLRRLRRPTADKGPDLRSLPTLPVSAAYDLWAETYAPDAHNALMALEQTAMLWMMPPLAGRTVLDLACGTGRYSRIAVEAGAARVIGTDTSIAMLKNVSAPLSPSPFPIVPIAISQASMDRLPFTEGAFDVVICALATGHLTPEAMRQTMAEIARVMRQAGEALISDFHPALYAAGGRRTFVAPDGQTYAVEHYPHTVADYRAAVANAGLKIVAIQEPRATFQGREVEAVLVFRCQK